MYVSMYECMSVCMRVDRTLIARALIIDFKYSLLHASWLHTVAAIAAAIVAIAVAVARKGLREASLIPTRLRFLQGASPRGANPTS